MKPQAYGPTDATTTKIGLGGAFLTASSFADGVATVRRALDLGVRYFDTSPMYCQGASQAVFGEALEGVEQDYLLATKLGYFAKPSRFQSRTALLTQFEENLRLLRRESVDTLQVHEADFHHWWSKDDSVQGRLKPDIDYHFDDAPGLKTLRELKEEGRCRFIGISGNTADNMQRVLENIDIDTFLLAFNYDLICRRARDILPIAREKGCVALVGAIFQRGLASPQPERLNNPPDWMTPDLVTRYQNLYQLQRESGMSLAEMGVRYVAAQDDIDTIIIGAKLPSEIEECVKAVEKGPLPEDLLREIEANVA
ncbi:MAG: aldo/keto reductase [Trueperaceae bacterium]|nr:aldo/keto reductase [Trueperaceae bacterium]